MGIAQPHGPSLTASTTPPHRRVAEWQVLRVSDTSIHMKVRAGARRPRPRPARRRDEHRRARREQLVDATLTAVGRYGAGVGMEEIAAEAGTSKTVVYRHFADRSELYVAVCNRVAASCCPSCGPRSRAAASPAADGRRGDRHLSGVHRGRPRALPVRRPPAAARPADDRPDRHPLRPRRPAGRGRDLGRLAAVPGRDPAAAAPWGHGVVGLVRSAADWWLRADRPMLRAELAAT